ncbi:hypothetical protein H2203_005667 [Taxawa tesnikishii (nom. ined.)]|nr:hypothetical protein H2203_005667 [Dothideales sp. JES 119]
MASKRPNDGYRSSSPKRQRFEDNRNYSSNSRPYQNGRQHQSWQGAQNHQRNNRSSDNQFSTNNQKQAQQEWAQMAMKTDPWAALELALKAVTSSTSVTKERLSKDGVQWATNLLEEVSARDKRSATDLLDASLPSTFSHTDVTPFSSGVPLEKYPLPPLPDVDPESPYAKAPFTHKSKVQYDRQYATSDTLDYEKLEFLGDAYIEIIATRLIFSRYPHFSAGRQAQVREKLVKNTTLGEFAEAYGFRDRLQISEQELRHIDQAKGKGSKGEGKGWKIFADVFEAYVAAIILSDPQNGFQRTEKWLTELWAPILLSEFGKEAAEEVYNGNAKQELQQKILTRDTKLDYRNDRPMEQSKHSQKFFVALYFTGFEYKDRLLGKGEGPNRVVAGNKAAMAATKDPLVAELAQKIQEIRAEKKKQMEEEAAKQAAEASTET